MAAKRIEAIADTGQTLYAVICRQADGYLMNAADGSFSAAPANIALSLTEDATAKGLYIASESRTTWDDGAYSIIPYIQTGGSPAAVSDIPGEAEILTVSDDAEVTLESIYGVASDLAVTTQRPATAIAEIAAMVKALQTQTRAMLAHILDLEKKIRREKA
jgi:hypothetical protein